MEELRVTTIEEIKQLANGELIELPPFTGSDKPFVARLKKVGIIGLCKSGRIPNTLLGEIDTLFSKDTNNNSKQKTNWDEMTKLIDIFVEEALVEPTLKELKENGIQLQDDQLMAIFNYTQKGVRSVSPSFQK